MDNCPNNYKIMMYVYNFLQNRDKKKLENHFSGCEECYKKLIEYEEHHQNMKDALQK